MWNLQICSEYFILLVEPISIRFCLLTCRKQKLVRSKILQQELFVLISDFWQFRHSNFGWDRSNLKKIYASARKLTWKIDNIKSSFRDPFWNCSSKYKEWRTLLHRVIAKQKTKREQTHPECLHAMEKYENVESVNTQNEYKTTSKIWTGKKKIDLFFGFVNICLNSMKTNSRLFKRISRK